MRLRTLPLSLAGVLLGGKLALERWQVNPWVLVLVCLTTVCLQILSNLSNELGDVLRGTDTAERQGPAYGLNSGVLSLAQMKGLIRAFVVLCCIGGAGMILLSFGTFLSWKPLALLVLGACAIWAAMKYTLGKNPYGYRFFSVGVLNINNIRDMRTDAENRVTVALRLGLKGARIYQTVLLCLGWSALVAFSLLRGRSWWFLLALPLFLAHLRGVWTHTDRSLDRYFPMLVFGTFILAIIY